MVSNETTRSTDNLATCARVCTATFPRLDGRPGFTENSSACPLCRPHSSSLPALSNWALLYADRSLPAALVLAARLESFSFLYLGSFIRRPLAAACFLYQTLAVARTRFIRSLFAAARNCPHRPHSFFYFVSEIVCLHVPIFVLIDTYASVVECHFFENRLVQSHVCYRTVIVLRTMSFMTFANTHVIMKPCTIQNIMPMSSRVPCPLIVGCCPVSRCISPSVILVGLSSH